MAKTAVFPVDGEGGRLAWIFCPGCKMHHTFKLDTPQINGAIWNFNENVDNPTFNPSLLVFASNPDCRCHSFVCDGNIQFLDDCYHGLKNQTVNLPDIDL
jgi:hypothetical protein